MRSATSPRSQTTSPREKVTARHASRNAASSPSVSQHAATSASNVLSGLSTPSRPPNDSKGHGEGAEEGDPPFGAFEPPTAPRVEEEERRPAARIGSAGRAAAAARVRGGVPLVLVLVLVLLPRILLVLIPARVALRPPVPDGARRGFRVPLVEKVSPLLGPPRVLFFIPAAALRVAAPPHLLHLLGDQGGLRERERVVQVRHLAREPPRVRREHLDALVVAEPPRPVLPCAAVVALDRSTNANVGVVSPYSAMRVRRRSSGRSPRPESTSTTPSRAANRRSFSNTAIALPSTPTTDWKSKSTCVRGYDERPRLLFLRRRERETPPGPETPPPRPTPPRPKPPPPSSEMETETLSSSSRAASRSASSVRVLSALPYALISSSSV